MGRVCEAGACDAPCGAGRDCPGTTLCSAETGHCTEPDVCATDLDCLGERVCEQGRCLVPECETHTDCAADRCVDRECSGAGLLLCEQDEGCAGGAGCAPAGVCLPTLPCVQDVDCLGGAPRCDPATGTCRGCLQDADCAPAEECQEGACALTRGCGADADCPGERTCGAELGCLPAPGCPGDALDTLEGAPLIALRDHARLQLCDGDQDRYRVRVPADRWLGVTLRHAADRGDLSLSVTTSGGQLVGQTDGTLGWEAVAAVPQAQQRELTITVAGRPGFSPAYTLQLDSPAREGCLPDSLEGPAGNDTADTATPAAPGLLRPWLCPGEDDWFVVQAAAGSRLLAEVTATGADAPVGLELSVLDSAQQPLAEGVPAAGDALAATVDLERSGPVFVRVSARHAQGHLPLRLHLAVSAADEADALACQNPELLRSGEPLTIKPWRWPVIERFPLLCGAGDRVERPLAFSLATPSRVALRASGAAGPLSLALRGRCAEPGTELECVAEANEDGAVTLDAPLLPAGDWFVILGAPPEQALLLELTAIPDACQADAECGAGWLCVQGHCQAACAGDDDCPGRQTCDVAGGRCQAAAVCVLNEDCVAPDVCRAGECVNAECRSHDDCPALCVDYLCVDPPDPDCLGDGDCPGGWACGDLGVCAPAGPCADDGDCPANAPRCNALSGLCLGCLGPGDCFAAERCRSGRCELEGTCWVGADCPGHRTCGVAHVCEPAACEGDHFDGEDGLHDLELRTHEGLVLCDGDVDAYTVTVPAGVAFEVELRHGLDAGGDLSLRLNTLGQPDVVLGRSDGPLGVELVGITSAALERRLEVHVGGRKGWSVPYSLDLRPVRPPACPADGLEGVGGNDGAATATALWPGDRTIVLCPGDEEWFSLPLAAGTQVSASLTPSGITDSHKLTLLDGDEEVLARAETEDGARALSHVVPATGRYLLRAGSDDPAELSSLRLVLQLRGGGDSSDAACGDATELALDEPAAFPLVLPASGRLTLGCDQRKGHEFLATFTLEEAAHVRLEVVDVVEGASLAVRPVCDDHSRNLVCKQDGVAVLDLAAGTYYAVVLTIDGRQPRLLMTSPQE